LLDFLEYQSVRGTVKERISGEERTLDPYSWGLEIRGREPVMGMYPPGMAPLGYLRRLEYRHLYRLGLLLSQKIIQ